MAKVFKRLWNMGGPPVRVMLLLFAGLIVFAAVLTVGKLAGFITIGPLLFLLFTVYVLITVAAAGVAAVDFLIFHPDGWPVYGEADFCEEPVKVSLPTEKGRLESGDYELYSAEERPIRYAAYILIWMMAAAIVTVVILNIVTVSGVSANLMLMQQPMLELLLPVFVLIVIGNPFLYLVRRHHKRKYYRVTRIEETADHTKETKVF